MLRFNKLMLLTILLSVLVGLVYANDKSVLGIVTINPNPMEKSTLITLRFNQKVNAEVYIESFDGIVIKTLYSGEFNNSTYEFFWNRYSDTGEYVPEGEYNLVINYELRYTSTKKTIILK